MAVIRKKIWPQTFDAVAAGSKKCELRLNDFEIIENDTLILEEWDPQAKQYTGRKTEKKVTDVQKFLLNDYGQETQIKEKGLLIISLG